MKTVALRRSKLQASESRVMYIAEFWVFWVHGRNKLSLGALGNEMEAQ
jgi:hypothetical protein